MPAISWKPLMVGAAVAATLALGISQAEACWRCGAYYPVSWGYTAYYTPCYTSYCTVGCDPCWSGGGWYLGWRPGPIRRLLFGPYRWYSGGSTSYYGGWDYALASYAWDTCCPAVTTMPPSLAPQPTPAEAQKPALPEGPGGPTVPSVPPPGATPPGGKEPAGGPSGKTPEPPAGMGPSTSNLRETSGLLTIYVPEGTDVFINGLQTKSTGTRRQYVSYGLKPGFEYKYEVRAEILAQRTEASPEGTKVVERKKIPLTRTVVLRTGDHEKLAFTSDIVTISDPVTGEKKTYVTDGEIGRMDEELAGMRHLPLEPRPADWLPTRPAGGPATP